MSEAMKKLFELARSTSNAAREAALDAIQKHIENLENEIARLCKKLLRKNPALKFEDIKEGMWVWDNEHKAYGKVYIRNGLIWLATPGYTWSGKWQDNHLFRWEVE